jgi:uncharacterized protein (DUF1499 family)
MKKPSTKVLGALVLLTPVVLAALSIFSKKPQTGLRAGKLRRCPDSPNCVVSETDDRASRHIDPFSFEGPAEAAMNLLRKVVADSGGEVGEETSSYMWATFTSRIFRFVDDVEFRVDTAQRVIHVRSASRAGYSDLGANRKRVEALRDAFESAKGQL